MITLRAEAALLGITPPGQKTLDRYGLTANQWFNLLKAQGWQCPICQRRVARWNTDHAHVPGWKNMPPKERRKYVRGVLCAYCNHRRVNSHMSGAEADRIAQYLLSWERRSGLTGGVQ